MKKRCKLRRTHLKMNGTHMTNFPSDCIKAERAALTNLPTELQRYISEVNDMPKLDGSAERELAESIARDRCPVARARLLRANLRLVVAIACNYSGRGVPLSRIIAEGNLGLASAADEFDPSQGVRFSTFAVWWIKQAIRRVAASGAKNVQSIAP